MRALDCTGRVFVKQRSHGSAGLWAPLPLNLPGDVCVKSARADMEHWWLPTPTTTNNTTTTTTNTNNINTTTTINTTILNILTT